MPLLTPRPALRSTAVSLAVGTFMLSGLACSAWAAGPQKTTRAISTEGGVRVVDVAMTMRGFSLPTSLPAGFTTFRATTADPTGHALQGFQLNKGVTLAQVESEFKRVVSSNPATDASAIRALERDVTAVGGPTVDPATAVSATLPLTAGTYYFFDFSTLFAPGQPVRFLKVSVTGRFANNEPRHHGEIIQTERNGKPRFIVPAHLNLNDTFLVRNDTKTEFHEAVFQQVKPGTTDTDVQAAFDATAHGKKPPSNPFTEQAMRGAGALSPGRSQLLHFEPSAGLYALLCFIPDDQSGLPHAFEGMHQVVRLAKLPAGATHTGVGGAVSGPEPFESAVGGVLVMASAMGAVTLVRRRRLVRGNA
ncbi:MAG: hypothetical protein HOY79_49640 [Streptomyces sp.]|nr:hypothetical protein [Streptomyces sp.]